jgi:gliding motility-associated-like protein
MKKTEFILLQTVLCIQLKVILSVLILLICRISFSQINTPLAITSGAASSSSADFIHEFSIGDMSAVETFTSPSIILTQGFLQPDFEIETIVVDDNCLIPNGISPNDDGVNDTWFIPCLSIYPKSKVRIFNRWGQQIYEGTGNESPWNGTYRGENLPMADYYFIISIEELDKKITGTITLKR